MAKPADTADYWRALEKEVHTQRLRESPHILEEDGSQELHSHGGHFVLGDASKRAREAMVSGLRGGSILEAVLPVLLFPAALLAMANAYAWWQLFRRNTGKLPTTISRLSSAAAFSSTPPSSDGEPVRRQQRQRLQDRRPGKGAGVKGTHSLSPKAYVIAAERSAAGAELRRGVPPSLRSDAVPFLPLGLDAGVLLGSTLAVLTAPSRSPLAVLLVAALTGAGIATRLQVGEFRDLTHAAAWRAQKTLNLVQHQACRRNPSRAVAAALEEENREAKAEAEAEAAAERGFGARGSAAAYYLLWLRRCGAAAAAAARGGRGGRGRGRGLAFLSNFRGAVVLVTCMSILAVDFGPRVFDRRYAKTETFGVSLMDLGAGLFVYSSGLCSQWARQSDSFASSSSAAALQSGASSPSPSSSPLSSSFWGWWRWNRSVVATLALGGLRLAVNRALNYQEHASEYGLHWNFFVTLAAVWALAVTLRRATEALLAVLGRLEQSLIRGNIDTDNGENSDHHRHHRAAKSGGRSLSASASSSSEIGVHTFMAPLGMLLLALHQLMLLADGARLTTYVLEAPRTLATAAIAATGAGEAAAAPTTAAAAAAVGAAPSSWWGAFFAANREGILSVVPHTALYLFAEGIGRRAVWAPTTSSLRRVVKHWTRRTLGLFLLSVGLWLLFALASGGAQLTSRRLGNAAYVFLVAAVATTALALFLVLDLSCEVVPASRLLEALSHRQLATFLTANLLTGAANIFLLPRIGPNSSPSDFGGGGGSAHDENHHGDGEYDDDDDDDDDGNLSGWRSATAARVVLGVYMVLFVAAPSALDAVELHSKHTAARGARKRRAEKAQ